jgi:hypothetical protein
MKRLDSLIEDPEFYRRGDEGKAISKERKDLEAELEKKYLRWEELTTEIENILREQ